MSSSMEIMNNENLNNNNKHTYNKYQLITQNIATSNYKEVIAKQLFCASALSKKITNFNSENVVITPITEGLSNYLFKVTLLDTNTSYFLKIFGLISDLGIVNRVFEEEIINKMSEKNICPAILDSDKLTYRIEEFLYKDEYRNYDSTDIGVKYNPDFLNVLFDTIVDFNFSFDNNQNDNNSNNNSNNINNFLNKVYSSILTKSNSNYLSKKFYKFLSKFNSLFINPNSVNNKLKKKNNKLLFDKKQAVVMTHNDIHLGNVMISNSNLTDIKLIDYEYSCFSYLGFDVANYFVENCFDFTHSEYPYYKVTGKLSDLFENKEYYENYLCYICKIDRNIIDNYGISYEEVTSKAYFYKLLCLSSCLWSLVAILNIEDTNSTNNEYIKDKKIDNDSFDFASYANKRLEIFDYYLKNILKEEEGVL